jgi:hypothetical protein
VPSQSLSLPKLLHRLLCPFLPPSSTSRQFFCVSSPSCLPIKLFLCIFLTCSTSLDAQAALCIQFWTRLFPYLPAASIEPSPSFLVPPSTLPLYSVVPGIDCERSSPSSLVAVQTFLFLLTDRPTPGLLSLAFIPYITQTYLLERHWNRIGNHPIFSYSIHHSPPFRSGRSLTRVRVIERAWSSPNWFLATDSHPINLDGKVNLLESLGVNSKKVARSNIAPARSIVTIDSIRTSSFLNSHHSHIYL